MMSKRSSTNRTVVRRIVDTQEVEGQSMVEYSLILVLMVIVCLSILTTLSQTVYDKLYLIVGAMP
jgi:Flp pilus assembly pilin Flp